MFASTEPETVVAGAGDVGMASAEADRWTPESGCVLRPQQRVRVVTVPLPKIATPSDGFNRRGVIAAVAHQDGPERELYSSRKCDSNPLPKFRGAMKQALSAHIPSLVHDYESEPARHPRFISHRSIGGIGVRASQ
jgi:hypothetical protein